MQAFQIFLDCDCFCEQTYNVSDVVEIVNGHGLAFVGLEPLVYDLVAADAVVSYFNGNTGNAFVGVEMQHPIFIRNLAYFQICSSVWFKAQGRRDLYLH